VGTAGSDEGETVLREKPLLRQRGAPISPLWKSGGVPEKNEAGAKRFEGAVDGGERPFAAPRGGTMFEIGGERNFVEGEERARE